MTKPAKLFLIGAGSYLLLLSYLLLSRPRSGYTTPTGETLMYYVLYAPLLLILFGLALWIRRMKVSDTTRKIQPGNRQLLWGIIALVILGFAFNLDYQRQVGCFVEDEDMFSPLKFAFSLCSIGLLWAGYSFSHRSFGKALLITELFIWTTKSLYFNGSLDLFLPGYFTVIAWFLRMMLITGILNKPTADTVLVRQQEE